MGASLSAELVLRGSDGFSVVESVAAIGLLTIVFLGMAVGADHATHYTEYSRSATTAMTLVHDRVEQLEAAAPGSATLTGGNHSDGAITSTGAANGPYTRTWTVTNNTPMNGLETISVNVAWNLYGKAYNVSEVMVRCTSVGC